MSNLFKKSVSFTDIHFGKKANSTVFNEDCTDFGNWFCKVAKEKNAETCFFLGDWHENRNTINVSTLNYTLKNLRKLNDSFENVYFIVGNHDLYFREKREVHSLPMGNEFPNIKMIEDITTIGNVSIVPWLVNDEWKKIQKLKSQYVFGHFEIPGFKLNTAVEMPDHGEINASHFVNQQYVFSGHFHARQCKNNIHYIGNPFGHNYGDSWDANRGLMFLEWDGKPEYVNYDGPKYITMELSKLITDLDKYLLPKTYIKCESDIEITYSEANELREKILSEYKDIREFKLVPQKSTQLNTTGNSTIKFQTIDEIIVSELNNLEEGSYQKNLLLTIYNGLD